MNAHSTYDAMRHLADSWGLVVMAVTFVALAAWPFRPGARADNEAAAKMILREDDHGE